MKFFLVISIGMFAIRTYASSDSTSCTLNFIGLMTSIGLLITQL
jgi:hypothetical protein